MNISGESKVIASAYIKARTEMSATVTKDAKGVYGNYATLAAIVEATSAVLAKYGLAVLQEASSGESGVCVDTWLIHESGATMQFAPLTMPLTNRTPQAVGSAITYARRYQLAAVCGLAPDDDDAQAAEAAQKGRSASVDAEVLFGKDEQPERLSKAQMIRLHELGEALYRKEWEERRPELVRAASKGAVESSKDLTPKEAETLIKGMEKRLKEVEAKRTEQAQAAQQPAAA